MPILPAAPGQLEEIYELFRSCKAALDAQNIFQWIDAYPTRDVIAQDIRLQQMYALAEDNICKGVVVLNEYQDTEYAALHWRYEGDRILVVHRLAVHPQYQGAGYARQLMDFAEDYALQNGYDAIRLDAYSPNQRSINFYEKRGYEKSGEVHFPGRTEIFYCYEKLIKG